MFTTEQILQEMIDYLEYRKNIMEEPYIVCGVMFCDMLKDHYDKKGEYSKTEYIDQNNCKFILVNKNN